MTTDSPVMIDLGVARDVPEVEPRPTLTWRRLRPVALALAAVLLLSTGGSGLPPAPALVMVAALPYRPSSPFPLFNHQGLLLTEDRLLTATYDSTSASWRIEAYELERGRSVWTYGIPGGLENIPSMRHQAGLVLLTGPRPDGTAGMRTVAIDALTGAERWSLPHQVYTVTDDDTVLAVDEVYPADAAMTEDSVPEGEYIYVAPWGQRFSQPPSGMLVASITLSSGMVRWRSGLVANVQTDAGSRFGDRGPGGADQGADLLAVVTTGAVELWDPRTGAVRHRFPAAHPETWLQLDRDLLLVQHTEDEVTAYSTVDYRRLWAAPVSQNGSFGFCTTTGLICDTPPTEQWVVDPATGARTWQILRQHRLVAAPGQLLETVPNDWGNGRPLRTVDPLTGESRIDLADWRTVSSGRNGAFLLSTGKVSSGPTWFGLLGPDAAAPVPLGQVPVGVTDCELSTTVIACNTYSDGLHVWRYRAGLRR
ncbi:putative pyrroloquinoline-quinone binding quinoprotein [Micromonospora pisi]|uniref:Putative pyrroloquinoline-quinone binding quinoprotein n=1 Tax=Micromonospora pisi TaxID=589240 RepID=A0A495JRH7_9ACTN|nr:PQQ-binding-like beta-propeller repeat protein [Micromonospora pisi]RKR90669.1 putative pyrroloquinoline-quinone binding quinoprotein [Micromonospora pisi]